ncbi:hypothetical protein H4W80_002186 [Nonomuraea angiospora]|uniref:Uncharacterized protein n=1 Tax=Nonomuraea angiospora TaxID=46172 RepID=A0ABR9LTE2_9ACTN|nr:hypothetical protein [Nonomuraea angiospora]
MARRISLLLVLAFSAPALLAGTANAATAIEYGLLAAPAP